MTPTITFLCHLGQKVIIICRNITIIIAKIKFLNALTENRISKINITTEKARTAAKNRGLRTGFFR